MRWGGKIPEDHDRRTRRFFAWVPCRLSSGWVWWEYVAVQEIYHRNQFMPPGWYTISAEPED